jgi:hypothetical protein
MEFIPSIRITTTNPLRAVGSGHLDLWVTGSRGRRGEIHFQGKTHLSDETAPAFKKVAT